VGAVKIGTSLRLPVQVYFQRNTCLQEYHEERNKKLKLNTDHGISKICN
jgi:hypothetical protein